MGVSGDLSLVLRIRADGTAEVVGSARQISSAYRDIGTAAVEASAQTASAQQSLAGLVEATRSPVDKLQADLKGLEALRPFVRTAEEATALKTAIGALSAEIASYDDSVQATVAAHDRLNALMEASRTPVEQLRADLKGLEALKPFTRTAEEAAALKTAIGSLTAEIAGYDQNVQDAVAAQQRLAELIDGSRTPVEQLRAELKGLEALRPFVQTAEEAAALQTAIGSLTAEIASYSAEARQAFDDQGKLASLVDRLEPAGVATRQLAEDQALLRRALDDGAISAERYNALMGRLGSGQKEVAQQASISFGLLTKANPYLLRNMMDVPNILIATRGDLASVIPVLLDLREQFSYAFEQAERLVGASAKAATATKTVGDAAGVAGTALKGEGEAAATVAEGAAGAGTATDALKAMLGRLALTIGGVVAVTAVLAAGFIAFESHTGGLREVERSMALVGNTAGLTADRYEALAKSGAATAGISVASARSMEAAFTSTGRIGGDVMERLIGLSRDYATATGQSTDEAKTELSGLFADPAKGAQDLADKMNLLSASEVQHVKELQAAGRYSEAQTILVDKLGERIKGAAENTSWWARQWNALGTMASNAADRVGAALNRIAKGPTVAQQAALAQQQAAAYQSLLDAMKRDPQVADELARQNAIGNLYTPGGDDNFSAKADAYKKQAEDAKKIAEYWAISADEVRRWEGASAKWKASTARANQDSLDLQKLVDQYAPAINQTGIMTGQMELLSGAIKAGKDSTGAYAAALTALKLAYLGLADPAGAFLRQQQEQARITLAGALSARDAAIETARQDVLRRKGKDTLTDEVGPDDMRDINAGVDASFDAQHTALMKRLRDQTTAATLSAKAEASLSPVLKINAQRQKDYNDAISSGFTPAQAAAQADENRRAALAQLSGQTGAASAQLTLQARAALSSAAAWKGAAIGTETYVDAQAEAILADARAAAAADHLTSARDHVIEGGAKLLASTTQSVAAMRLEADGNRQIADATKGGVAARAEMERHVEVAQTQSQLLAAARAAEKVGDDDLAASLRALSDEYDHASKEAAQAKQLSAGADAILTSQQDLAYAQRELDLMGETEEARSRALASLKIQQQAMVLFKDTSTDALRQQRDDWVALQERIADTQAITAYRQKVKEVADETAGDAADAIYDQLTGANDGTKVVDWFKTLFKRIAVEALKAQILLPITTQIVGAAPGLFGISGGVAGAAGAAATGGAGLSQLSSLGNLGSLFNSGSSTLASAGNWIATSSLGQSLGLSAATGPLQLIGPAAGTQAVVTTAAGSAFAGGLAASPWGIVGSLGANLLGLGGGLGGTIGGALGSIGGGVAGSAIGGTLLGIGAGPIGAVLGGFLGSSLGGLFGGEDKNLPWGQWSAIGGKQDALSSLDGYDTSAIGQVGTQALATLNTLAAQLGIAASSLPLGGVGYSQEQRGNLSPGYYSFTGPGGWGADAHTFATQDEAIADFIARSLQGADTSKLSANTRKVLNRGVLDGLAQFQADLSLAATDFSTMFDAVGRAEPDQTATAIATAASSFVTASNRAQTLGLATDGMAESLDRANQRILDTATRTARGLSYVNDAYTIKATFDSIATTLVATGKDTLPAITLYGEQMSALVNTLDVSQLQQMADALRGIDDVAAGFAQTRLQQLNDAALNDATDPYGDLQLRALAARNALGEVSDGELALAQLRAKQAKELAGITSDAVRRQYEMVDAMELQALQAQQTKAATEAAAQALSNLNSAAADVLADIDKSRTSGATGLTPTQRVAAADSALARDLALARSADSSVAAAALQRLTTTHQTASETYGAVYGSGAAETVAMEQSYEAAVRSLPSIKSYQQQVLEQLAALPSAINANLDIKGRIYEIYEPAVLAKIDPAVREIVEKLKTLADQGFAFTSLPTNNQRQIAEILSRVEGQTPVAALDFTAIPADAKRTLTEALSKYSSNLLVTDIEFAQMPDDDQRLLSEYLSRYRNDVKVDAFAFSNLPADEQRSVSEALARTLNGTAVADWVPITLPASASSTLTQTINTTETKTVNEKQTIDLLGTMSNATEGILKEIRNASQTSAAQLQAIGTMILAIQEKSVYTAFNTASIANQLWGSTVGKFAFGGRIDGPGTETSDSIPLWGSVNEWMVNARSSALAGWTFMGALNAANDENGLRRAALMLADRTGLMPRRATGGPIAVTAAPLPITVSAPPLMAVGAVAAGGGADVRAAVGALARTIETAVGGVREDIREGWRRDADRTRAEIAATDRVAGAVRLVDNRQVMTR